MSRASERLEIHNKHLQSSNMAATSNFYSIVAGVGAGTGTIYPDAIPRLKLICCKQDVL
jgi:hypothetical protein